MYACMCVYSVFWSYTFPVTLLRLPLDSTFHSHPPMPANTHNSSQLYVLSLSIFFYIPLSLLMLPIYTWGWVYLLGHLQPVSGLMISAAGHKDMRWMAGRSKESSDYWGGASVRGLLSFPAESDSCILTVSTCTVSPEPWGAGWYRCPIWG